jgi:hypothetical protein
MQLHKRFTKDQVNEILGHYLGKQMSLGSCLEYLKVSRSRFFVLVSEFKQTGKVNLEYQRHTPAKLSSEVEEAIFQELEKDHELVVNKDIPIYTYNYESVK